MSLLSVKCLVFKPYLKKRKLSWKKLYVYFANDKAGIGQMGM